MNHSRRILCVVTLAIGLLPTAGLPFWIYFGDTVGNVHQGITRDSLLGYSVNLGNGKTAQFTDFAISELQRYNKEADADQSPERHFDNELLGDGSRRLIRLRQQIFDTLVHEAFIAPPPQLENNRALRTDRARFLMGEALHTMQDFYAHSNWVEKFGATQVANGYDLWASFGKLVIRQNTNITCDMTDIGNVSLTTGHAGDNKIELAACVRPLGKCPHGLVTECPIPGDLYGLNKDGPGIDRPNYGVARQLATESTRVFIEEVIRDVLRESQARLAPEHGELIATDAGRRAVCHFLGITEDEAYVECLDPVPLNIDKPGEGNGTITFVPNSPECGPGCGDTVRYFYAGERVTLTATPDDDSLFVEWTAFEDCDTDPICEILIDAEDITVAANFAVKRTLEVNKTPADTGRVVSDPPAIDCGTGCTNQLGSFPQGYPITLTATPAEEFVEWSGNCTPAAEPNVCELTIEPELQYVVEAVFAETDVFSGTLIATGLELNDFYPVSDGMGGTDLISCEWQMHHDFDMDVTLAGSTGVVSYVEIITSTPSPGEDPRCDGAVTTDDPWGFDLEVDGNIVTGSREVSSEGENVGPWIYIFDGEIVAGGLDVTITAKDVPTDGNLSFVEGSAILPKQGEE